jgi:hypothetical protein
MNSCAGGNTYTVWYGNTQQLTLTSLTRAGTDRHGHHRDAPRLRHWRLLTIAGATPAGYNGAA